MYPRSLEDFIESWHWNESSHKLAVEMGEYILGFIEHIESLQITDQVKNRHIRNALLIGHFECIYRFHDHFSPEIFLHGSPNTLEFRHQVSDSKYLLASFNATWRKLRKYVQDSDQNNQGAQNFD